MKNTLISLAFAVTGLQLFAQTDAAVINLKEYLEKHKLVSSRRVKPFDDGAKHGISCKGIVWIKGMPFSTGIIEVDLRGKDVFQESFLGVAFHGVDTTTYEAIYFRPFNFRAEDAERKIHAVQYVSAPDYHWDRLRKEHNGVYEKGIVPPPEAEKWFHARVEIGETSVKVFVNHEKKPSLVVQRLSDRKNGLVGLWSTNSGVDGDFANLSIKELKIE